MNKEPVAILAALNAFLGMLVTLGVVDLTDVKQGAIMSFLNVVIGLFARSKVTPNSSLEKG